MARTDSGQLLAIISAALFGVSPVLCKTLIGDMSPALLAGLLYLGSGIGLELLFLIQGKNPVGELTDVSSKNRCKLLGALLSGGIIAPLCLTYGIKYGNASEVTLLLNLETVATTVISWLIFREYIGARVWGGKLLILLGAAGIVIQTGGGLSLSLPGLLIIIACIFWGIDNNLTRDVVDLSSINLAGIKGLGAGVVNITLALLFTTGVATPLQIAGALTIGALSYGLSLVLFIEALRRIGAARTTTFFAVGPFFGALLSIVILDEKPPSTYWIAAILMLGGIILLYRERHGHLHTHEPLSHRHGHTHDEHHTHIHDGTESSAPHDHSHSHEPLTHIHGHWPDIHHRHGHKER
ncbi:MAG TPA: EamA family transporter [Geobacteraceae bacterium]|nr:EamA family transporter [Geobacteraceae bacterium]